MAIDAQTLVDRAAGFGYSKLSTRNIAECLGEAAPGAAPPVVAFSYVPATAGGFYATGGIATPGPITPFTDLAAFNALDPATITLLYLPTNGLTSITGLNTLPNLQTLCLDGNNLTTVDFTGCTALVNLFCSLNPSLTSINLTGCTALGGLVCNSNTLTTLDVTGCTALRYLICNSNALTVTAVNTLLSDLVSNGQTGGTVNCSTQTPFAPPDAGPPNGIVAKAALLAELPPWVVITD